MLSTLYISDKEVDINRVKNASKLRGREVISRSGIRIGKVRDIVIRDNSICGVLVWHFPYIQTVYIAKSFIASETEKTLMLSIDPITLIVGKQVIDKDGRKLGKVHSFERSKSDNSFDAIMVRHRFYSKMLTIPTKEIAVCEENIILSTSYPAEK